MINCRSHGCCCWLFWFVNEKDFSTKQFNGFSSEPRPQKQNLQLLTFLHKCKVFRGRGPLIAELEFSSETWEWFLPWEFFESLFEQVFCVDGISKKVASWNFFCSVLHDFQKNGISDFCWNSSNKILLHLGHRRCFCFFAILNPSFRLSIISFDAKKNWRLQFSPRMFRLSKVSCFYSS